MFLMLIIGLIFRLIVRRVVVFRKSQTRRLLDQKEEIFFSPDNNAATWPSSQPGSKLFKPRAGQPRLDQSITEKI